MLFFPATEPLSSTPDANRYLRALEQAATNPSASGDSIAWSIDDAAAYWAPDWKPPSPKSKTLPADAVMGMVTRAFLIQYGTFMPIEVFFRTLQCLRVSPNGGDGPYQSISAHGFCYAAHMAYAPPVEQVRESFHRTGLRAIAERHAYRCGLQDCSKSETLLGRCLPHVDLENARRSGIRRPVHRQEVSLGEDGHRRRLAARPDSAPAAEPDVRADHARAGGRRRPHDRRGVRARLRMKIVVVALYFRFNNRSYSLW
jgi:hypothetical protein